MANKYARQPDPSLFDVAKTVKPRNRYVRWHCRNCDEKGTIPDLESASIEDFRDGIQRGHARRSAVCDREHRLRYVWVERNGMNVRFGMFGALGTTPAANSQVRAAQ